MTIGITFKSSVYQTTNTASNFSGSSTWTPASGSLIVCFVCTAYSASPTDPSAVSGHGVSYSKLTLGTSTLSTTHKLSAWVGKAGASPTSAAPTATVTSGNGTGDLLIEFEVTGADVSGTALQAIVDSTATNSGASGTSATVTLASPASSDNRAMTFVVQLSNAAPTTAGSWTLSAGASGNFNTPATGAAALFETGAFDTAGAATVASGASWRMVGLEIKAATLAGETDNDWWGGAQGCMASVARAGAAAALGASVAIAGSFIQQGEDFPASPNITAASAPPTQRVRIDPRFQRWHAGDELPTAVTPLLEEQDWSPPILKATFSIPNPWTDTDEVVIPVGPFPGDGASAPPTQRASYATSFQRWYQPDDVPLPAVPLGVDEVFWSPPIIPARFYRYEAWADSDYVQLQRIPGDAASPPPTQRARADRKFVRFEQGDDLPVSVAPLPFDVEPEPQLIVSRDTATYIIWAESDEFTLAQYVLTTNANDTLSASGSPVVSGSGADTNANDTLDSAGAPTVTAALNKTNANDTSVASGTLSVTGSLATTNEDDESDASGHPGGDVLAYTNANDTLVANGSPGIIGSLATTNANDTLAAVGVAGIVRGTVDATNADDTLTTDAFVGSVGGSINSTNNDDRLSADGPGGPVQGGGGGHRPPHKPPKPKGPPPRGHGKHRKKEAEITGDVLEVPSAPLEDGTKLPASHPVFPPVDDDEDEAFLLL